MPPIADVGSPQPLMVSETQLVYPGAKNGGHTLASLTSSRSSSPSKTSSTAVATCTMREHNQCSDGQYSSKPINCKLVLLVVFYMVYMLYGTFVH